MLLDDFDYDLPPHLVAQTPRPRGEARLMTLTNESEQFGHHSYCDLPEFLHSGDVLVVNDSRVSARRVRGVRASGAKSDVLLLRREGQQAWWALIEHARSVRLGAGVTLLGPGGVELTATVLGIGPEGARLLGFRDEMEAGAAGQFGIAPLPPYIHAGLEDEERYQTVYSAAEGSAAAPTAGLHLTVAMLDRLRSMGVVVVSATLHVGVDTFRPVRVANVENHEMHGEWFSLGEDTAEAVNSAKGRVVAVGTTAVRVLESAAIYKGRVRATSGETRLFIRPGFEFRVVDAILTNFHLPKSTLLMMVSAFCGRERMLKAYGEAIDRGYLFYSFGDAMLMI